jgi:hypothetical protein
MFFSSLSGFDTEPTEAWTTKEELTAYFKQMYMGRRMEILCDTNYKVCPTLEASSRRHSLLVLLSFLG